MPAAPVDLAGLMQAVAVGDREAFADFYDATVSRVYSLAFDLLRDGREADEVTRDAYVHAWRSSLQFDPGRGSALAWLLSIVHRAAVERIRTGGAPHLDLVGPTPAREATPYLSAVQVQALDLTYRRGYTHAELAAATGVSTNTAASLLRTGLLRLRDGACDGA